MKKQKIETIEELFQGSEGIKKKGFVKAPSLSFIGLCFFSFLLVSLLSENLYLQTAELKTFDWRMQLANPNLKKEHIVHIDIDQKSLAEIGKWPFSRKVHADIVSKLSQAGVKQIVFDVLFQEENEKEGDLLFAKAMREAGTVFLPLSMEVPKRNPLEQKMFLEPSRLDWPLALFRKEAVGMGFVDTVPDLDGSLRRIPLLAKKGESWIPHLVLSIVLESQKIKEVSLKQNKIKIMRQSGKTLEIPVDSRGFLIINWAGKWESSFPHISYSSVLNEDLESLSFLRNAICFIGFTAPGTVDLFPSPVGPLTPAVGGLANATNTLLTQQWIQKGSRSQNLILSVFMVLLIFLCYGSKVPWLGLGVTLSVLIFYPNVVLVLFYFKQIWIDMVLPFSAIVMSSLFCEGFNYLREYHEKIFHFLKFKKLSAYTGHVIESMSAGILTVDVKGVLVNINQHACQILSLSRDDMGKTMEALSGMKPFISIIERVYRSPSGKVVDEVQKKETNKEPVLFSIRASLLRGDAGQVLGAIILFDDVTRERQLEEKVQQSRRLASLGELASGVVHEVKNPLAAIRLISQMLPQFISDPKKVIDYAEKIVKEVDRLNEFVIDFLQFARPDKPKFHFTDINEVIREVLALCQPVLDKNHIQVQSELKEAMPKSLIDPNHLRQVLINLIQNAAQAMEKMGKIYIKTRLDLLTEQEKSLFEKQYEHPFLSDENLFLKIDIQDEGPGFAQTIREHLFEPFHTTKQGGTGLGLAISHKLIEVEQGLLELVPDCDIGAHFKIILPFRETESIEKAA